MTQMTARRFRGLCGAALALALAAWASASPQVPERRASSSRQTEGASAERLPARLFPSEPRLNVEREVVLPEKFSRGGVRVEPRLLGELQETGERRRRDRSDDSAQEPADADEATNVQKAPPPAADPSEKADSTHEEATARRSNESAQTADELPDPKDTPGDLIAGSTEISAVSATADPVSAARAGRYNYGLWVLAPALMSIILAIAFRQVVPALFLGILTGAYMLTLGQSRLAATPTTPPPAAVADYANMHSGVGGFRYAVEQLVLAPVVTPELGHYRMKIIFFTLIIGFAVGVMGRNGGTAGMVEIVAGRSGSPRRGLLTSWLAGLVVFFDDYANAMIIGPTMQSVFDKLKLSRAKLAYIVDTTSAPVASLAIIGTWIGAEIAYLGDGLKTVKESHPEGLPGFITGMDGMAAFVGSIPYRFYAIFALVLTFWICLTRRDFGPMWKAESRALSGESGATAGEARIIYEKRPVVPRWWLGFLPIFVLVGITVGILMGVGWSGATWSDANLTLTAKISETIKAGGEDISYLAIFYGAWGCAITAMLLTFLSRACSIRDAGDAGLEGMARMFPAIVILVLAWGLSQVCSELELGRIVAAELQARSFPIIWTPVAIFVCACIISFSTGTSWGTMGILCPTTVIIMAEFFRHLPADQVDAMTPLFYSAVGAVLTGAIFGDHCSPISDTTVLASLASGCRHEEHVWTQMPYALLGAAAAVGCGNIVTDVYGQPWTYAIGAGVAALLLVVLIVGRPPRLLTPDAVAVSTKPRGVVSR
ncbi:MAG: hypothetical protein FLDDKLPJ_00681 [Phycisphaerae bacterium]|nr:hypothetical protein [Phycisphaerae bacterium]